MDIRTEVARAIIDYLENEATTTTKNAYKKVVGLVKEGQLIDTISGHLLQINKDKLICTLITNICSELQTSIKYAHMLNVMPTDVIRSRKIDRGLGDQYGVERAWKRVCNEEPELAKPAMATIKAVLKLRPMINNAVYHVINAGDTFILVNLPDRHVTADGISKVKRSSIYTTDYMHDAPVDPSSYLDIAEGGLLESSLEKIKNMTFNIAGDQAGIMRELLSAPEDVQVELFGGGNEAKAKAATDSIKIGLSFWKQRGCRPFHTGAIVDFRGRVSQVGTISFVSCKPAKALLRSGSKKALGKTGYKWILRGLAGAMGHDKATWAFREKVISDRLGEYIAIGANAKLDPVGTMRKLSATADNPWKALTFCLELAKIHASGKPVEQFMSDVMVGIDATCSGIQHMAMLTRNESLAEAVNVIQAPNGKVNDVYGALSAAMLKYDDDKDSLYHSLTDKERRKISKKLLMLEVYGGKFITHVGNIRENLEDMGYQRKWVKGEDKPEDLALPIAHLFKKVLENDEQFGAIHNFLEIAKGKAKACTDVNEHFKWTIDVGYGVQEYSSRYVDVKGQVYNIYQNGKKKEAHTYGLDMGTLTEPEYELNKRKTCSAAAPNLIHSLDATFLHLVVDMMSGRDLGLTHDCMAAHPADMDDLQTSIRKAWKVMFVDREEIAGIKMGPCDFAHRLEDAWYSYC